MKRGLSEVVLFSLIVVISLVAIALFWKPIFNTVILFSDEIKQYANQYTQPNNTKWNYSEQNDNEGETSLFPSAKSVGFFMQKYTTWNNPNETLAFCLNHYDMMMGTTPTDYIKNLSRKTIVLGVDSATTQNKYDYDIEAIDWNLRTELYDWIQANWQNYLWASSFSSADKALEDCFVHVNQPVTVWFAKTSVPVNLIAYDTTNPQKSRLPGPWDRNYDMIMNVRSPVYRSFWQDYYAVKFANNMGDGYYLDVAGWPRTGFDMSKVREFSSEQEYMNELSILTDIIRTALHNVYPQKKLGGNTYDNFNGNKFTFEDNLDIQVREGSIRYIKAVELLEKEINNTYNLANSGKIITMTHTAFFHNYGNCLGPTSECIKRDRLAGLAMYYLAMNENVYFFSSLLNAPTDDPIVNNWFDAISYDIGSPLGKYYIFAQSQDPSNPSATYKILARNYTKALVLLKPRPDWSVTNYGSASSTTHTLPETYRALDANSVLGPEITSISLKNWEGAILIKAEQQNEPNHLTVFI